MMIKLAWPGSLCKNWRKPPVQSMAKASPNLNLRSQWYFCHLQPVWLDTMNTTHLIHFKLDSAAVMVVFVSLSAKRKKTTTVTSVFWFKLSCLLSIIFWFLAKCPFFSPLSQLTSNSLWNPDEETASLSHNLPKCEMVLILTSSGSYNTETKNYYILIPLISESKRMYSIKIQV